MRPVMRNRRGFTFVELMIVVTIMGLLASIALNRLIGTQSRSFVATMKSDLRNFALAEESYFYDFDVYSGDVTTLENRGFAISTGASVSVNEATVLGWSTTATHANTPVQCYIFIGSAAPVGSATTAGEISCS